MDEQAEPIDGRPICDARLARCRCAKDAGHVEAGDDVHQCHPERCTGAWAGDEAENNIRIVQLPFAVGEPRAWPDDDPDDWTPAPPLRVRRGGIRFGQ